jgi:hypothetical protein
LIYNAPRAVALRFVRGGLPHRHLTSIASPGAFYSADSPMMTLHRLL